MKKLILLLSLVSNISFAQGSITLTPENTTIETKTNQPLSFSTDGLERLKINTNGNIGIGQTNPTYKLDILHSGSIGIRVKSSSNFSALDIDAFNGDAALRFANNGSIKWNIRNSPTNNNLQFIASNFLPAKIEIELSTGNVGIGTSSPTAKLDINGTAKIGTNGTAINEIIKVTVNKDIPSVAADNQQAVTFAVSNAALNSSVYISPASALPAGLIIAHARVSVAGTVEVVFYNVKATAIDPATMNFFITVIN